MSAQAADVRGQVLHAVENYDITRSPRGARWWTSEHAYRTLTAAEKKHLRALIDEGLVRFQRKAGQRDPRRGYYERTSA